MTILLDKNSELQHKLKSYGIFPKSLPEMVNLGLRAVIVMTAKLNKAIVKCFVDF